MDRRKQNKLFHFHPEKDTKKRIKVVNLLALLVVTRFRGVSIHPLPLPYKLVGMLYCTLTFISE
jgi:hypothetical protein